MKPSARGPLLGYGEIATHLGVSAHTVRSYRSRGRFPEPDDASIPDRPRWHQATVDQWHASRQGQGNHTKGKHRRGGIPPGTQPAPSSTKPPDPT
jgi:predicted DNA-binding transcriptional regulator AlpA